MLYSQDAPTRCSSTVFLTLFGEHYKQQQITIHSQFQASKPVLQEAADVRLTSASGFSSMSNVVFSGADIIAVPFSRLYLPRPHGVGMKNFVALV